MTVRELSVIKTQLEMEQLMIQKYTEYSKQTQDPQLKNKCEQIAAKHMEHYEKLLAQLG